MGIVSMLFYVLFFLATFITWFSAICLVFLLLDGVSFSIDNVVALLVSSVDKL